jgi:hypothetical protein
MLVMGSVAILATACSESETETPSPAVIEIVDVAGRYEVHGVTRTIGASEERQISGIIILAQAGTNYTATFDLETTIPGGGEEGIPADVIGTGEGRIHGRTLRGMAQTQIVTSVVPGVDVAFAFVPRATSTRILSSSKATIDEADRIRIEIESKPAEGASYAPTRTVLMGSRVQRFEDPLPIPSPPDDEPADS